MPKPQIPAPPGFYGCIKCRVIKPLSEFNSRNRGNGVHPHCRPCKALDAKERRAAFRLILPPAEGTKAEEFRRPLTMRELENFSKKIRVDLDGTGCWEWQAAPRFPPSAGHGSREYGAFWFDGKVRYAHRVSWHIAGRSQPPGLVLDHMCLNGRCVNPHHLRVVTPSINGKENTVRVKRVA